MKKCKVGCDAECFYFDFLRLPSNVSKLEKESISHVEAFRRRLSLFVRLGKDGIQYSLEENLLGFSRSCYSFPDSSRVVFSFDGSVFCIYDTFDVQVSSSLFWRS